MVYQVQRHLLLSSDPEFVSAYEREGFYPALSTNPQGQARMHAFNPEIVDSIKAFFADYITGSNSGLSVLMPDFRRSVALEVAMTIPSSDCNEERKEEFYLGTQELRSQLEQSGDWLKKLLFNYIYASEQMDEDFRLMAAPARMSAYTDAQRSQLRQAHNILTSDFLRNTRAARRQILTLRSQLIRNTQFETMLYRGIEYRQRNPTATFTVSCTAGFISIGNLEQSGCGQDDCHCQYNPNIQHKFEKRENRRACPVKPVNIVLANLLEEVSPFRNNTAPNNSSAIKITVLDDERLARQRLQLQDNALAEANARSDLQRFMVAEEMLHQLLWFWYHSSSYKKDKMNEIFKALDDCSLVAVKYLSNNKQSRFYGEMMHIIQEKVGLPGDWYYKFDDMCDDLINQAKIRKTLILTNTF
jgi:hypothetical protein